QVLTADRACHGYNRNTQLIAIMRMHIINIALSLLLFVASFPVAAQKFNPYYYFKHLNVENGLAQNVVYHFSEA
ncbi:MAG TPA: hypothetical protein VNV85_16065, partial [Puia sp.]|nr:hypothetical protein [Puia sp.]